MFILVYNKLCEYYQTDEDDLEYIDLAWNRVGKR